VNPSTDSSTQLAQLAVAVSDPPVGRPPRGWWRLFIAYTTTVRVVLSYLSLRLQMRFRSPAVIDEMLRRKNLTNSRRIHKTISRLQGLFIKVGQLISIMTNFLPPEFRSELEGLQDQVPPRPYSDVEKRVKEELGKSPRELFAEFDERPVASASIGQVHRAKLPSGEVVAVKVQYPDIEEIVRLDLRALRWIFDVVSYFVPYRGLDGVYREIRAMILQELDFRGEADNVERIAARFGGRTDVGFPRVVKELSTGRILTTEWIDAVKVSDRVRLQALGIDRARLARRVVAAYCQQIFTDGVYHADPHPGNLLVRQNAAGGDFQVVFIDFGAVAEVSPRMRRGIADLIQAALTRDTPKLVQAMKDMGFIARGADPAIFDKVIDFLHQKFQEEIQLESFSLKDVKFDPEKSLENLADLRRMDVSIRDMADHFHVPKEWILLERTVLLLMGLCTELDPSLNPMEVIRPYLEEFVLGKDRDWSGLLVNTTKDIAGSVLALPSEVKKFLGRAQRGELEVRFRGIDEHARLVYALGHQLIWAALGITAGAFGMVFDGRANDHAAKLCFYAAAGFGVMLLGSMTSWRFRLRRRRR
jgi:ubiquinone biosynthesis protein